MLSKKNHRCFALLVLKSLVLGIFLMSFVAITLSHARIILDGSMGTPGELSGPSYVIGSDLGRIRGRNLFHSFGRFDVLKGESATFRGPDTIENVIGRVTWTQSYIDGLLRCDINRANLFLINPHGVVFGENASLDVSGSFHVSTADYIGFEGGERFYAQPDAARDSLLSVAHPEAFGFLGSNPKGISVKGSVLKVKTGKTLSLIGGDIDIAGSTVEAASGRVNIASVASSGEVIPGDPDQPADLRLESFDKLGNISMSQGACVLTSGDGAGTVLIRGGQLTINSASGKVSGIYSTTLGNANGAETGVDIHLTGTLTMSAGEIASSSREAGRAGNIKITADSIEIGGDSQSYSSTNIGSRAFSSGDGGDITITTDSLLIKDEAFIETTAMSIGDGGDVKLTSRNIELLGGSYLGATSYGKGAGGDLGVAADDIRLSKNAGMGTYTGGADAGDVKITAGSLHISEGAYISSSTSKNSFGNAGDIDIKAGSVFMTGSDTPAIYTGIFANTWSTGKGGNLHLISDSLTMKNHTSIQAMTLGRGDGGNVHITTGNLELMNASIITTGMNFGLEVGNSGDIEINADRFLISGLPDTPDPFGRDATALLSEARNGQGGDVRVVAKKLILTGRGSISTSSYGIGKGGSIEITAGDLQLLDGSNIIASAFGSGDGGTIDITANDLLISGAHPDPFTAVTGNKSLSPSGIASQTGLGGGDAGYVRIAAERLQLLDGGRITVETFGTGTGGRIEVKSGDVLISGVNSCLEGFYKEHGRDALGRPIDEARATWLASSRISAGTNSSFLGDGAIGDAGNIKVEAVNLRLTDHGLISTQTTSPGAGGNIELRADYLTLSNEASVSAASSVSPNADKAGDIEISANKNLHINGSSITTAADNAEGGNITLRSRNILISNGSLVSAESSGAGDAGNIDIAVTDTFLAGNSVIRTEARHADGGNIGLKGRYMIRLVDSEISSSVGGGADTIGGNITIDPEFVILNKSRIIANAFEGRGGNIDITAGAFLADPSSLVSASSERGINGTVDIRAPITSISESLNPLTKDFAGATELLREPCEARIRQGKGASLVISGRDGLSIEPGGLLPSPM